MTRWSEKQLAEHQTRRGIKPSPSAPVKALGHARLAPGHARLALGRLPAGDMNKTEAAYDAHLWLLRSAGEVLWHKFEGIKLRLADKTFYTPDFVVMLKNGILEMREVKGFMMEDANVKIKVAASIYPFRFLIVRVKAKKYGGGWTETEV